MTQKTLNKQVVPETVTGFIEKLEALPRYAHDFGGMICTEGPIETCVWVNIHDINKLIEQAKSEQEQAFHPYFHLEYTCKRIRRLLRLLDIPDPSPDKDDVLMACLFSLLGTACGIIERTQAKAEKQDPVGHISDASLRNLINGNDVICGKMNETRTIALYTTPPDQTARIAELESQRDRLLACAKTVEDLYDYTGDDDLSHACAAMAELIKEIEAIK